MSLLQRRYDPFTNAGRIWIAIVAALAIALAAGCSANPGSARITQDRLPSWLVRVYPKPDARSASFQRVEVDHHITTKGEDVRPTIDGVDVTQYADFGRDEKIGVAGRLVYDPERANEVVRLSPGKHRATVERVRLTDIGGTDRVLDSYSWEFFDPVIRRRSFTLRTPLLG